MGLDTFLKMLPHIEHDAFVIPPVDVMLFSLFEICLPSIHYVAFLYVIKTIQSCFCPHYPMQKQGLP